MIKGENSRRSNRIVDHPVFGADSRTGGIQLVLDGREITAVAGETIAAAMRAHGIVVHRTMPGSDSPRGTFCGVGRCPDCMMTVDGKLNVRACVTTVRDGMVIGTQRGLGVWNGRG